MSALFFAELQRLKAQVDALAHKVKQLTEIVEAAKPAAEPKRGPGRPAQKAVQ